MSGDIRMPRASVILVLLLVLSAGYLFFPTPIDSPTWYPLHLTMAAAVLGLALFVSTRDRRLRDGLMALSFQLALLVVAGGCVKILSSRIPLMPLVLFAGYPFSLFALRTRLVWVPGAVLFGIAAGLSVFREDHSLVAWAVVFAAYSLFLGRAISKWAARYDDLKKTHERLLSDAKDMGRRIREQKGVSLEFLSQREEMEASAALKEDELLQGFMKLGCYFMDAMSGILLFPEESDSFRIRAATLSRSYADSINKDPIPGGKGIIRLAREREDQLVLNDIRPGSVAIPFYTDRVPVRSLMLKVVSLSGSGDGSGPVSYILYFDSTSQDAFVGGEDLNKRLEAFCGLLSKVMETESSLQRVSWDVRSKVAISQYAESLTKTLILDEIAGKAVEAILKAVPHCDGAAFLLNDSGVKVTCTGGDLPESLEGKVVNRSEPSLIGLLIRNSNEIVFGSERPKPSPFFHAGEKLGRVVSFAAVPSLIKQKGEDRLMAVLVGVSSHPEIFVRESIENLRVIADITAQAIDNAMTHRQVREMSRIDGLTGLYNHRTFHHVLEKKLRRLESPENRMRKKDKEASSVAVVMVDADHFKYVNDTYGHPVGDEVLRDLAGRLRKGVRGDDTVARYGGEEFAIILDSVDSREARKITGKLRKSVEEQEFVTTAGPLRLTVSMGYAILTRGDKLSRQELLDMADQALYSAKKKGRNRVVDYRNLKDAKAGTAGPV